MSGQEGRTKVRMNGATTAQKPWRHTFRQQGHCTNKAEKDGIILKNCRVQALLLWG